MNQTPNYALSQWSKDDQVLMEDFNADNAKIDAAIKAEACTRAAETAALSAELAARGNCRVVTGQYTGTGTFGKDSPTTFTFDKPVLLFVMPFSSGIAFTAPGCNNVFFLCKGTSTVNNVTWNGQKSLGFWSTSSASAQYNTAGQIYSYFALLEA